MKNLLSKAQIDQQKLKTFLIRVSAEELSKLSEPCYFPSLKKYYFELLHLTHLTENDIRKEFQEFFKGTKAAHTNLVKDPITCLLIFIMHYFLLKRDQIGYSSTMLYHMIRQYTNLMNVSFPKFCDPDTFKYTLDNIIKTHLFAREKNIPNAIYYLSTEMIRRWTNDIKDGTDPDKITKFIFESRHRLSQSIKSFAEAYYRAKEEGLAYKKPFEAEDKPGEQYQLQTLERGQRLATEISTSICVYKQIDKDAIEDSRKITKINAQLANSIANELSNVKYTDQVRMIVELYLKELKSVSQLCGNEYIPFVRSLLAIKRTTKTVYFKQQVADLTSILMVSLNYKERFDKLTSQTQFLIISFVAFYITMVVRHTVCKK